MTDLNKYRFCLAPMRGVTTVAYRNAFMNHFKGLDEAMAPFVPTVHADTVKPKLLKDIAPEINQSLPLIPQIIGRDPHDFMVMADAVFALGYDEVNWNLGCPWKHVRKKKRGSGLLTHPDMLRAVLDPACEKYPGQISVKVRLGIGDNEALQQIVPLFNDYPLKEVTIHPRTAEQMYDGTVDLDAFEAAYKALTVPVAYNGDINDLAAFQQLTERFPDIHHYMLGRGLLMNPFLCEILKTGEDNIDNKIERIRAFHSELCDAYKEEMFGDKPVLGKMKEMWKYLAAHLTNGKKLFKKVKKANKVETYEQIIEEYLTQAEWSDEIIWRGDVKESQREE
ncbi:tRNA dihydrouridine synthase [Verrucomicrobiota bacterium]